ncbi:uncharacterized protein LOC135205131 [Macrobrachium nipponense]|uniref:uncharacterized protein LOC135205131 n=1 Tax=Macrobrachium nipponense TaxID=159736 RepID=UPI0030C7DE00
MRSAQLLSVMCAYLCFARQPGALSVSTKGVFITTGPEYNDVIPDDPPLSIDSAYECGRQCAGTEECTSFLMEPSKRLCHLSKLNRCVTKDNILVKRPGFYYYEVLPHDETNSTETCFALCLKEQSCGDCGRPHCTGKFCDICTSYCWDIPGGYNGSIFLWSDELARVKKRCFNTWEALYTSGVDDLGSVSTPRIPVRLRLKVMYQSGQSVSSDFESMELAEGKLTVGKYIKGPAGNYWKAPFQDRLRTSYPNTTCRAFFYEDLDSCQLRGEQEIQFDEDGNVLKQGFVWLTPDPELNSQLVTGIEFWIQKI